MDIFSTGKRYDVIYADPPWSYQVWSDKGKGRSAESHYPTMQKTAIQELPISDICQKDCVLFLWVTSPCLIEGLELIKAWGFTYKTVAFTWIKQCRKSEKIFMGMGYYTRANAEYCLLATKGKVLERSLIPFHRLSFHPLSNIAKSPTKHGNVLSNCSGIDRE